jgi:hypothetical protein
MEERRGMTTGQSNDMTGPLERNLVVQEQVQRRR